MNLNPLVLPQVKGTAVALAADFGIQHTFNKTLHGLIRGSKRFELLAVITSEGSGDAGEAFDGVHRGIPIFKSIQEMLDAGIRPEYSLVACTMHGEKIDAVYHKMKDALTAGISVVNGCMCAVSSYPELVQISEQTGGQIIDYRKVKRPEDCVSWNHRIRSIDAVVIDVQGIDSACGKRTTSMFLIEELRASGINAQIILTGPTGWMQSDPAELFWVALDAIPDEYVCGELIQEIIRCNDETHADVIILEGQGSFLQPLVPFGSEYILSANSAGTFLVHSPAREYYDGTEDLPELYRLPIRPIRDYINVIEALGGNVPAIVLNGSGMTRDQLFTEKGRLQEMHKVPVVCPMEEGVASLVPVVRSLIKKKHNA